MYVFCVFIFSEQVKLNLRAEEVMYQLQEEMEKIQSVAFFPPILECIHRVFCFLHLLSLSGVSLLLLFYFRVVAHRDPKVRSATFHAEYGCFMIETTPSQPYGGLTTDLRLVSPVFSVSFFRGLITRHRFRLLCNVVLTILSLGVCSAHPTPPRFLLLSGPAQHDSPTNPDPRPSAPGCARHEHLRLPDDGGEPWVHPSGCWSCGRSDPS